MAKTLRLATRNSPLAMKQAELVKGYILEHVTDYDVSFVEVSTSGDRNQEWSLEKQGGSGLFTAEVANVVMRGEADIGVHSAKDMPSADEEGMEIIGYLPREDVRDVLIKREELTGDPSLIATGSPRRRAQGKKRFPTAVWCETRGNVVTRLKKVVNGKADATFLAAAGLKRLGINEWEGLTFEPLEIEEMVPAGGQGAVALQVKSGAFQDIAELLDEDTKRAVDIERSFLAGLGVGCHSAFAVHYSAPNLHLFHEELGDIRVTPVDTGDSAEIGAIIEGIKKELEELS